MYSHSAITIVYMGFCFVISWLTGAWVVVPVGFTAFIIGLWYSREQYWEERQMRDRARLDTRRSYTYWDVLVTMAMVFRFMERNLDFYVPSAIALVLGGLFIWFGHYAS